MALQQVSDVNEAVQDVSDRFAARWLGEPVTLQVAEKMYGMLVEPNLVLDSEATERKLAIAGI